MLVSASAPAKLTLDEALRILTSFHTDDGALGGFYILPTARPEKDAEEQYMASWGVVRDHLGLL